MREIFEAYKPRATTRRLLYKVLEIVEEYRAQGLRLTLRQLYYQLVSKDLIPNQERSYKMVGNLVSNARLGGILDWDAIEDRVRRPQSPPEYGSLEEIVDIAVQSFRLPRLVGQERYVELWVEKDALAGVLHPVAYSHHVTLMVNRGYSSTSAMREAGVRIRSECEKIGARGALVLYLGDLDPSGEDMVRDVRERLQMFTNSGYLVHEGRDGIELEHEEAREERKPPIDIVVEKLALTMEQVEKYNPPPNPAKLTDSRAAKFVETHGYSSWEVDALPPRVLRNLIETRIEEAIDSDLVEEVKEKETKEKARLRSMFVGGTP